MDKSDDHNAGSLGEHFEDFEATPNRGVWDRISDDLNDDTQRGGLAVTFSDYAPTPNKRVWAGIEADLHPERKRRAAYWWWGAAAGLALLITAYFAWPDGVESNNHLVDDQEQVEPSNNRVENNNTPSNNVADGTNGTDHYNDSQNAPINPDNGATSNPNELRVEPRNDERDNSNRREGKDGSDSRRDKESVINSSLAFSADSGSNSSNGRSTEPLALSITIAPLLDAGPLIVNWNHVDSLPHFGTPELLPKNGLDSRWLLAGNVQPYQPGTPNQETDWISESTLSDQAVPNNTGTTTGFNDTTTFPTAMIEESYFSSYSNYFGAEEYNAPLNFGLTFNRRFGRRWGIESGFSYSIMRSQQKAYLSSTTRVERNNVRQYLGLPLQLQFYAIQRRKLSIYFSSGALLETGLNMRIKDNLFEDNEITETNSTKVPIEGGQIALTSGFGIDFSLGKRFSIYAQPNITHYIHQSQYNLWSTQRFWGSLQTGLRIHL